MKVYHIRAHYMCFEFPLLLSATISTRLAWMLFPYHSISSHSPHPLRMPFALPFLMVATAAFVKLHQKSNLTKMTMTKMTKNKSGSPLWSEPECIRFSCHVSPELLVTSAVKSPLVRRKVRPWLMAASIWGSRARVAKAKRSPTAERTLLSITPNGGLRNPPVRRRMERMSET